MGRRIASLEAMEILDSRGNPTLRVYIELDDHRRVAASVPSGLPPGSMRRANCETVIPRDTAAKAFVALS